MDCQQKIDPWYGPTNLDERMSENVENIWRHHRYHHKSHGKLSSEISNRRKILSEVKISRSIFHRDCCYITKVYWMSNYQNGGWKWNGNLYNINKIKKKTYLYQGNAHCGKKFAKS